MISSDKVPKHLTNENNNELLKDLYKLVSEEVRNLPRSRIEILKAKVFILPAIYLGLYIIMLFTNKAGYLYFLYSLMGFMAVIIFSNLIHELCHGNVFKSRRFNALAYLLFDFLGANSYIWQKRHLNLHHKYPNTNGWDADVEQKGPIAIFPNEKGKRFQRYQHIYIFTLYPLFFLNWLLIRDFRDYFSPDRVIRRAHDIPGIEYLKLLVFKSMYLIMVLVIPWIITEFSFIQILAAFLILSFTGSLLAMIILLTPHVNSDNEFPQIDENGDIPLSWLHHQLITTNDISSSSWFTRNILGNFNYHLAHHLFPKISSVYAPELTKIVKEKLLEAGLPYRSYTLTQSFKKHYQLIRKNASKSVDII